MFRTKTEILRDLDPRNPATIQALIDFHRQEFGGFAMKDGDANSQDGADAKPGQDDKAAGGNGDTAKTGGRDDSKGGADDDKPLGANGLKALQMERDARQALETELKQFKAGLAEALGIETKDAKSDDLVSALQRQVQEMRHDNLVDRIARESQITDAEDLELIKAAPDETTMRKLAARLGKKPDDSNGNAGPATVRRLPRQDTSQGRGGGDSRATSVAQVMAERAAARAAKN
jgi:hypothetical protein